MGGDDDYVIVLRKGSDMRVAAWTTASGAHRVLIPLDPGKYSSVTHTGQNLAVAAAGQQGLALTLTTAPVYLSR